MTSTRPILQQATNIFNEEIRKLFAEQGHHLTGAWEESLSSTSTTEGEIEVWAKTYGAIVNAGTTADRIPFGGEGHEPSGVGIGSGTGEGENFHGVSLYIQGLYKFWKLRKPGISDKMALSLAFATAKVQKQQGMSTLGSRAFSQWGDRQHFVQSAMTQRDNEVADLVCSGLAGIVNETLGEPQTINY